MASLVLVAAMFIAPYLGRMLYVPMFSYSIPSQEEKNRHSVDYTFIYRCAKFQVLMMCC
jgi:hypothetical protein